MDKVVHHRRKHLRRNGYTNGIRSLGDIRTRGGCILLVQPGSVRPLPYDGIKDIKYAKLVGVRRGVEAVANRLEDVGALLQ